MNSDKFHAHLDACKHCEEHPFDLCPIGRVLIAEATGTSTKFPIEFAGDELTTEYDKEIQEIFKELYFAHNGKEPRNEIWTADGQPVGHVLDWDAKLKDYTPASYVSCRTVAHILHIVLTPTSIWEVVAIELRAVRDRPIQ